MTHTIPDLERVKKTLDRCRPLAVGEALRREAEETIDLVWSWRAADS